METPGFPSLSLFLTFSSAFLLVIGGLLSLLFIGGR